MKTTREQIVTEDHGHHLEIQDLKVAGKTYDLHIDNPKSGWLKLQFVASGTAEFTITVYENGSVMFSRHVHRPHHDHDDSEVLTWAKDRRLYWDPRWPSGCETFHLEFGGRQVDY